MMRNPDTFFLIRLSNGVFVAMYKHLAYADTDPYAAIERLRCEVLGG